jgi:serine phosphatase RsbU (regulator of sigma subunit)/CBS domain-containing protein
MRAPIDLPATMTVRELMVTTPVTVPPDLSIRETVRIMKERNIGAVLVGEDGRLAGIFTERDLLHHVSLAPADWQRPISDWMTADPWTIGPDSTWEQTLSLMETLRIRHVPVVEDGRIIGIVTARGLMDHYTDYLNRVVAERTRELREANERLQQRDAELRLHMTVAGRLQTRLLPAEPPEWPGVAWATHYQPVDPLGGDYYDFARPGDGQFGVLIADASGHSIPAAMVAIMARTAFAASARTTVSPAAVLTAMNRRLYGLTGEHFVSAFYAVYDRQTRRLTYANAGHPFPLRYDSARGVVAPLHATGLLLGIMAESTYDESAITLAPGDRLLFYTDGVVDQAGGDDGQPFGQDRLIAALAANADQSPLTLTHRLADALAAHQGDRPVQDDMTILAAAVEAAD